MSLGCYVEDVERYSLKIEVEEIKIVTTETQGPPGASGVDPEVIRRIQDGSRINTGSVTLADSEPYNMAISASGLGVVISVSNAFLIHNIGDTFDFEVTDGTNSVMVSTGLACKIYKVGSTLILGVM